MTLKQWLKKSKTGVAQFAEQVGIARFTLQRYLHKGRLPPPPVMTEIHRVTKGEVAPNDFYRLTAPRKRKAAKK
jgi:predicted site-specific integrase-resolvase